MTSSSKIAGGDIQLSVDRATASAELQQLRSEVRSTFAGMSDDALKFASAQDRLDRALKSSNGKITSSVRSAELNLRRVQSEAGKANSVVVRSANQAAGALHREEAAFGRLGRGALAGSGLLRGLGRSVAFASSTFLGGFGLLYAIESSTTAAVKQQEAEGQLETALKNRGQAVEELRGQVNALVASNAKLGFGEEDTTKALTLAVTTTGSLAGATRLLSVAQNVARAKGTDLYSSTQLVVKGFLGQARGIKSLGVDLANGVKGWAALDAVQGKYSGRAVAYANSEAGARARARAELERTKVTIGTELLPLENQLATSVADYLSKADNQAKIQRDVAKTAHAVGAAFKFASDHATEIKTALEILLALKVASTVSNWAGSIRLFAGSLTRATTASQEAAAAGGITSAETAIANTGGAAAVARGNVTRLGTSLSGLGAITIAPILIPIEIQVQEKISGAIKQHAGSTAASAYDYVTGFFSGGVVGKNPIGDAITGIFGGDGKSPDLTVSATKGLGPHHAPAPAPATTTKTVTPKSNLDRYSRIQLAIATAKGDNAKLAADKALIAYDLDYERKQEALLKTDPKNAKQHAAILQRLYGEEQSARDQITQIEDDAAAARKKAADDAAAARKKAADARKAAAAKARAAHLQALSGREGHLEAAITTDQTAEQNATTVAQLKLAQQRERHARELLIAFYVKESHDPQLSKSQRATAVKNAAKQRQELAKAVTDDRAAQLKTAVDTAESAVLSATEGTAAYAKAIAAEKKALAAEIAYYKARAARRGVTLTEKRKDVADELAAKKQLASLDKKKAAGSNDPGNAIREATATLEQIIANESNVRLPDGSLGDVHGTLKQMRTHLFQSENHLANIRAGLRPGPPVGPEFGNALRAGDAAFA